MRMILCGKCAAIMNEKKSETGAKKDNCQACGKRRYCMAYNVKVGTKAE